MIETSNDDNRAMDVYSWKLFAMLLLTAFCIQRVLRVMRRRPWVSVANARSLVFASGLLAFTIYFWFNFFKKLTI
jgi:hypothetical protein